MRIVATIEGVTPLLMHKFNPSALNQNVTKSKNITPEEIAEEAAYRDKDGNLIIPGNNIFQTIINGGKFVKDGKSKITNSKSSRIPAAGNIVELELLLNQDHYEIFSTSAVNNAIKARVMTHRPMFKEWELTFTLEMDDKILSAEQIYECLKFGGTSIGLGAFSPRCKGTFGKFKVKSFLVDGVVPRIKDLIKK